MAADEKTKPTHLVH